MNDIIPPIIILVEQSYLDFYPNIESAEMALEAIDVNDGLFEGYDSAGRLLNIYTQDQHVKINVAETIPKHQEKLKSLLKMHLAKCEQSISNEDLQALIKTAMDYRAPYKTILESLKDFIKDILNRPEK